MQDKAFLLICLTKKFFETIIIIKNTARLIKISWQYDINNNPGDTWKT